MGIGFRFSSRSVCRATFVSTHSRVVSDRVSILLPIPTIVHLISLCISMNVYYMVPPQPTTQPIITAKLTDAIFTSNQRSDGQTLASPQISNIPLTGVRNDATTTPANQNDFPIAAVAGGGAALFVLCLSLAVFFFVFKSKKSSNGSVVAQ